ncbi:hypothetical protein [Fimbriiglobus ruber]|uniref:Uncharacterized protein n=1 Tax=Fimbriiglobus ruber TaxID=1908690 RepID=A0A225E2N2_9BACT|nr:hypothetical protein [Fimbriiglobus ruber]OWK45048.1 hypothetical protein FRUB_01379 [Fimbriiglobus ruber]
MPQAIDVTGLSPEAVRAVESLVNLLREKGTVSAAPAPSVFDLFGKAPHLRSGDDIAKQIQDERAAWGDS